MMLPLAAFVGGVLAGCSSSDDNGVPSSVTSEIQSLGEAARKAGGNYDQLSDADKQKFIARAGNEEGARAMVSRMGTPHGPAAAPKG